MASMKAQAISLDLVAGLAIMLLLLSYYFVLWDTFTEQYDAAFRKDSADVALISISDQLVSSPGCPENWTLDPDNAPCIGLASTPNVLDREKVDAFSNLSYAYAKRAFGLDQDFLVRIESLDGARYSEVGAESNSTLVSEVSRLAVLDGQTVRVKVRVYG